MTRLLRATVGAVVTAALTLANVSGAPATVPPRHSHLSAPAAVSAASLAAKPSRWRPNGTVRAVVVNAGRIYLAGDFTAMYNVRTGRHVRRSHVAALNRNNGGLVRDFSPHIQGAVRATAVYKGKLVVGGDFTRVSGHTRRHLAAVRLSDGRLVRSWHQQVNGPVLSLLHLGGRVYVGGNFNQVGSVTRSKLFALRRGGKLVASWPRQTGFTDGGAYTLAAAPNSRAVIVGGAFHQLDGKSRVFLGAIGVDGRVRHWSPAPDCTTNCFVKDLAVGKTRVYAGIAGPGGAVRAYALRDGQPIWARHSNGDVDAVAISGRHLLIGGHFTRVSTIPRTMFAQLRSGSGTLTKRQLSSSGRTYPGIQDIKVADGVARIGGAFASLAGQRRYAVVAD